MNKVLDFFNRKGIIATWVGMIVSIPVNVRSVYQYFKNIEFTEQALIALVVFNVIGVIWFILPSKISIKAGKVEIIIDD
jgi:hypothetical protein